MENQTYIFDSVMAGAEVAKNRLKRIVRRTMLVYNAAVHFIFLYYVRQLFCRPVVAKPPPTVFERVLALMEQRMPLVNYMIVGVVLASLLTGWFLHRSRRAMRLAVLRLRGVKLEAMREGSEFRAGEQPKFQVAIMRPGLLSDTHYGFGVRVGNFLVTPEHVVAGMSEIILSANGNKIQVPTMPMLRSRVFSDLVYIKVSDIAWSKVGVKTASLASRVMNSNTFASISGHRGVSSGLLTKSQMIGLLVYQGSTVPGMSGAAYVVGNSVYGVHCGVVSNENMGVSSVLIMAELKQFLIGEASEDFSATDMWKTKPKKTWDVDEIFKTVEKRFKYTDEEQGEMLARGATWGDVCEWEKTQEAAPQVVIENGTIRMKPQGADSEEIEMSVFATKPIPVVGVTKRTSTPLMVTRPSQTEQGFEDILKRLDELEKRVTELEKKKPTQVANRKFYDCNMCSGKFTDPVAHARMHEKPICGDCGVSCANQEALENHRVASHPKKPICDRCGVACRTTEKLARHRFTCKVENQGVTKEASVDTRKIVKTAGAFLGRPTSPIHRLRRSTRSSSSSDKSLPSQSQPDYLKLILESQRSMQQSLQNFLDNIPGPSSATRQN
nr:hypothetical protein 1 [Virus sp.]